MKKRVIALLLCICLMVSAFPFGAVAEEDAVATEAETESTQSVWEFSASGPDNAILTAYNGTDADLVIPATVERDGKTYAVTGLIGSLFENNATLRSVVISEGVVSIGQRAFYNCRQLTSVTLPSTLTSIFTATFTDCDQLYKIIIPRSVTTISGTPFDANMLLLVEADSYAQTYAMENNCLYAVYDGVNEPEIYEENGMTYCLLENEAVAVGCDPSLTEATVAAAVKGLPVIRLRGTASNCKRSSCRKACAQ